MNYQGYEITEHKINGGYVITKNNKVITSQPSVEFAKVFIDDEIRFKECWKYGKKA